MATWTWEITEGAGVKVTMTEGPVLASIIFDPADADTVMTQLARAFNEASEFRRTGIRPDASAQAKGKRPRAGKKPAKAT